MRHYLDHASVSPLRPEAQTAMVAWDELGISADPGRVHSEGRMARAALEEARAQVAEFCGVRPRQVIFTSGGSESINSACWGVLGPFLLGGSPIGPQPVAVADVEHSAVREASGRLGIIATVPVDGNGRIHAEAVRDTVERTHREGGRPAVLVHCQWANHEVGTRQPIDEVAEVSHAHGALLHVDAMAAGGSLPSDLVGPDGQGADLVSLGAHTLGGPPGIGALILRRGLFIESLLLGGEQERGRRAGLEDVRAAIGFGAVAAFLTSPDRQQAESHRFRMQTERLLEAATSVDGVLPYGDPIDRVPHLICLGIEGVEAEPVLLGLDQAGVAAHSGSSCASESLEPSPVLQAMGVDGERSLRLSVGWSTSSDDIEAFADAFPGIVEHLRALRP